MLQWDTTNEALSQESLRPLHEVNQHCVEYLVEAANRDDRSSCELIAELGHLFRNLDRAGVERAAQRSFLLIDFRFGAADWWQSARMHSVAPVAPPAADAGGPFSEASAAALGRATLMLAWHCVRSNRVAARVMLGIAPDVAAVVSSLRLADIEQLAGRYWREVRPRWETRVTFWRQLLLAAQANEAGAMRDVTLQAIQLLAGECFTTWRRDVLRPARTHRAMR